MREPEKILIVRLSHLGDIVHALPVFHALRECFPKAEFGWAVQPEFAGLLEGLPGLKHIFHFERRGGLSAWWKMRRELGAWGPDLAVDCQGNFKSAAVTRISGAKRRAGYHRYDWREHAGARVLTETAVRVTKTPAHALDRVEALVRHFAPQTKLRTDLALSPNEIARGEELWREHGGEPGSLVIHLSNESDIRAWPSSSVAELACKASDAGRSVLLLSGPGEREIGARLAREFEGSQRVTHWVGQSGLRELGGFFHAAASANAQLVACDSGPMHLAVACGLHVLCLSGPQAPERTGPLDISQVAARSDQRALQAEPQPECAPCLKRTCAHADGPVCMTKIGAEQVLSALEPAN